MQQVMFMFMFQDITDHLQLFLQYISMFFKA